MTTDFPYVDGETIHGEPELNRLARLPINAQTGTTFTPTLADEARLVTLSNASPVAVTLPQDSDLAFPIGGSWTGLQLGAGQVTCAAGTGATLRVTPTGKTRAQYSGFTAFKIAANTWWVIGDLAAS